MENKDFFIGITAVMLALTLALVAVIGYFQISELRHELRVSACLLAFSRPDSQIPAGLCDLLTE